MRTIDIESAHAASTTATTWSSTHHDDHGATATACETNATPKETSAKTAPTAENLDVRRAPAEVDRPGATTLLCQLLAQIGKTILHFTGIKQVLFRPAHVAGDRHRFVALRRQTGIGKSCAGNRRCFASSHGRPTQLTGIRRE